MNKKTGFWITRIFLIIIATTLFIGCQKDDDVTTPQLETLNEVIALPNVNILSKEEFLEHSTVYNTIQKHLSSTRISNGRQVETNGMILEEEEVLYITYEDYHSYTFAVVPEEVTSKIKNVVLSLLPDGSYETSLFTYDLTEEEMTDFRNDISIDFTDKITNEEVDISQAVITILTTGRSSRNSRAVCYYDQYTSTNGYNYTTLGECEENHGGGNCSYNPIVSSNCPQGPSTTIGADTNDNTGDNTSGGGNTGDNDTNTDNDVNDNGIPDHLENPDEQTENTGGGGGDDQNNNNNSDTEEEEDNLGFSISSIIIPAEFSNIIAINNLIEPDLIVDQSRFIFDNPEFAEAAIEALENGGEVDFDEHIIYDFSDKPCQKNIIEAVISNSSVLLI